MTKSPIGIFHLCIVAAVAFIVGAGMSWHLSDFFMTAGIHTVMDIWFDADTRRIFDNLIARYGNHSRSSLHPFSSLIISTPALVLKSTGMDSLSVVRVVISAGSGLLASAFILVCINITGRILDAAIYSALLISSASFLFFAGIPELYIWGGASILLAILSIGAPERYREAALITGSVVSFGITVTNWMAGIAAAALTVQWSIAARCTILAFAIASALVAVQSNLYPGSGPFLKVIGEERFAVSDISSRIFSAPKAFFLDPIVLSGVRPYRREREVPEIIILPQPKIDRVFDLRTIAMSLWALLIGLAVVAALFEHWKYRQSRWAVLVAVVLVGQITLHIFYGEVPFLYSGHYMPLLVAAVATVSQTRLRLAALAVASVLIPLAAISNYASLIEAMRLLVVLAPPV